MLSVAVENSKVNECSDEWSFAGHRSIDSYTHGYHRYPAKFIPQIVSKLIETYATEDCLIVDPFAGCGTTLVEAKSHGYRSIGFDVNPVAEMITKSKITTIAPGSHQNLLEIIQEWFSNYNEEEKYYISDHPRLNYWFCPEQKNKIGYLKKCIEEVDNKELETFLKVGLSNILKTSSRWLQDSTKPQIDPKKQIKDPFNLFEYQIKKMWKKNMEFHSYLSKKNRLDIQSEIHLRDARDTGLENDSVDLVITSPPYATSYEYADIHQLSGYVFNFFSDLREFRKKFIGTFYSEKIEAEINCLLASDTVSQLAVKNKKIAKEIENYFISMQQVIQEIHRILKPGATCCMVVGDSKLREVTIPTSDILISLMREESFYLEKRITRNISLKQIPTTRHPISGRFTSPSELNSVKVYPKEHILIFKKR
ncbi:MAG: site-specific DNA-methyltransferase [Ignavibacteriaceae bacterium]|nr:MAG: site-specific DNA-methyltransferase [Ignavibacteriaceae bacterium]OQY76419.1 MAG: hypothetical protein B6D45_03500 [Ignavibacteriales bacterium UTCHB3]